MLRSLFFLLILCCLFACNNPDENVITEPSIDVLIADYEDTWNSHDSIAIKKLFDSDIILFDNSLAVRNKEELITKLIRPYFKSMDNMKHETIQVWAAAERAGASGFWTIDYVKNDSVIASATGAFTYIWKKSKDGEWKVITAHIHDIKN